MLAQFTSIESEKFGREPDYWDLYQAKQPEVLFWLCECFHYDLAHTNFSGNCRLVFCNCAKFEQKELYFQLEITKLDIFQHENPDLIFDSPDFWLIYESWERTYATEE